MDRPSKLPMVDLTDDEPLSLLTNDILKEITKNLGPTDLARLGLADRRLRGISSIQMAEILADPRLHKLAQKYRSRLLRPHIHFAEREFDGKASLFKFPLREVLQKGSDLFQEGDFNTREEVLLGSAYEDLEDLTKDRYIGLPLALHDDHLYMFPRAEPLPGVRFLRDQLNRKVTRQ